MPPAQRHETGITEARTGEARKDDGRADEASRIQDYERSLLRSQLSRTRPDRPKVFELCGLQWDLLDEVFAPVYSPSTSVALELLGLDQQNSAPRSGSFLEIGCGSGIVAVMAALAGHERVIASDVSPHAAENAAVNAERHGVTDRLRARHSDLFSALDEDERFDTVFWSSNYVLGPDSYEYRTVHERAFVDAGYRTHRRYLEQAPRWLTTGGSALLHFSDRGNVPELYRIAAECGRELRTVASCPVREGEYGDDMVEHMLLEIVPVRA